MVIGLVRPSGDADGRLARSASGAGSRTWRDAGRSWALQTSESADVSRLETDRCIVVHGRIDNAEDLQHRAAVGPGSPPSALVGALVEREGMEALRHLEGSFVVVIVDPADGACHIANDAFGSCPVYWQHEADQTVFGTRLAPVLAARQAPVALSMQAVADFATIGFVIGHKTLAAGTEVLEPGSVLAIDLGTGQTRRRRYFEPASLFGAPSANRRAYLSRVAETFHQAVANASRQTQNLGVSLSGGLDSRAILSGLNGHGEGVYSYTVGVPGCADQAIASTLSRLVQTRHEFFALDDTYLKDFLPRQRELVALTDGHYLSHGLTEMLVVDFLRNTPIRVLLRGHGGELAKTSLAWPLHTDARIHQMQSREEFVPYLAGRANYVTPRLPLDHLLNSRAIPLAGRGARDSLSTVLSGVDLTPPELCAYVYLREHHPRFTVPSLELFRSVVEVRLPFMNRQFLHALFSGPPAWRDDTSVHRALTRAGNPRLLRVRNSNTGAPADAGPVTEFVLDKVNTVLRRLNAPGYRHYHAFDAWLRTQLLDGVEAQLLAPESRVQLFVDRPTLEALVSDTRSARADHSYLLQVLLIIELWLRQHSVDRIAA